MVVLTWVSVRHPILSLSADEVIAVSACTGRSRKEEALVGLEGSSR